MGQAIGVFSTNATLAGGANIFTWVLGVWAIFRACKWLLHFWRESASSGVAAAIRQIRDARRVNVKLASTNPAFLVAYLARSFLFLVFGFAGIAITLAETFTFAVVENPKTRFLLPHPQRAVETLPYAKVVGNFGMIFYGIIVTVSLIEILRMCHLVMREVRHKDPAPAVI